MYVCLCKAITDSQIREAVVSGANNMRAVRDQLGVMTQCGKCSRLTKEIVDASLHGKAGQETQQWYELR